MSNIRRRQGVDDDIFDCAQYLIEKSEHVARRFVEAVQITLKDLAQMPRMGSVKQTPYKELSGLRSWRVKGFPNHLIYYFPLPDGIDVLGILHGCRDFPMILGRRV